MAKSPRPGEVKTRLCPPLNAGEAADLYRCFLLDKIETVQALTGAQAVIAYSPTDARADFEALAPGIRLMPQVGPRSRRAAARDAGRAPQCRARRRDRGGQ